MLVVLTETYCNKVNTESRMFPESLKLSSQLLTQNTTAYDLSYIDTRTNGMVDCIAIIE